jgi:hypothetical protein
MKMREQGVFSKSGRAKDLFGAVEFPFGHLGRAIELRMETEEASVVAQTVLWPVSKLEYD